MLLTVCWIVIAVSNALAGYSLWRFTKEAIPQLKEIRRATDVVKHHILRGVVERKREELRGGKTPNQG